MVGEWEKGRKRNDISGQEGIRRGWVLVRRYFFVGVQ